jgi:hypothetical protein
MQYTNKLNLPQAIVEAVKNDDYDSGDSFLTATQLNKPVQMVRLEKQYANQIIEDISDNIYALMGKAIHYILEKAESVMPVEKRIYTEVLGKKISCQLDRLALISKDGGFTGKVQDYKFASVWQYIYGLNKEYEEQLNIIAYILTRNGYKVNELEIIMIFRDWQKSKTKYDKSYPQEQVAVIPVKLWNQDKQEKFITDKIQQHESKDCPQCTQEERWNSGDKYAVMKKGNKKALRVLNTEAEAYLWIEDNKKGDYIEIRKGENKRCDSYCKISKWCSQYQGLIK